MPKIAFTPKELADYFNSKSPGDFVVSAREKEDEVRVHAEGRFPEKLINSARPHESKEVLEYRKTIYKSKTKHIFTKIFNSLSKIRRSTDWSIVFENSSEFSRIPEGETLEDYTTINFPYFDSITNWCFQVLLREYLIDPNAIIIVSPLETEIEETDFLRPYPNIINSALVIDFKERDYFVYENELGSTYTENGFTMKGKSFYVITTMQVLRYDQSDSKGNFTLAYQYDHLLEELPCYKIGAVLVDAVGDNFLYESRIAGILPALDEAAREYSDLQAAVIMNIYPERWEFASIPCHECNGIGRLAGQTAGEYVTCHHCKGVGQEPNSPFSKILVKPAELGQQQVAIPPAGYIEKDSEIVKLQDERVEKHLFNALASVNFEFLAQTPLSQSGIAKEVDKDETNNFVHSVAEDLVRCLDWLMHISARMRYGMQYSQEDLQEMMPTINVPEHFDIFSTKFIEEEIKSAKDNKMNPVLINAMEIEYASKKFSADPEVQARMMLILSLDPLANITEDEKMSRLSNKGITKLDYIISSNINQFVSRAIEEDESFITKDPKEQRETIRKFAEEIEASNEAADDKARQKMFADQPPAPGEEEDEEGFGDEQ
jgi:hypothetical protein